jgi:hypothetical protein
LNTFKQEALQAPLPSLVAKERIYGSQRLSRAQRDLRSPTPPR